MDDVEKVDLTEAELRLCLEAWNAAQTTQSGDRFAPDVLRLVMLVNRLSAALSALGGWNEAIEAAAHTVKTPYSGEQDDITREAMDRAAARIRALRRPATGEGDQPRKAGE